MSINTFQIIKQLKKYYLTKVYDLIVFRFYAVTLAVLLPIFGFALEYADPSSIEYHSHRFFISTYWLSICILSFKVTFFKKYMSLFTSIGIYMFVLWIIWIVKVNHFSAEYTVGFFLSFTSTGILFRNWKSLGLYCAIIIGTTIYAIMVTPDLGVNSGILLLSMGAIGMVYFWVMVGRSYVRNQLELLNHTLEEKVAARTLLAEKRAKELTEKNLELERFAYVASHDLKAPLRTIGGFVGLLVRKTEKSENKEIHEYSQYILAGIDRMKQTVDDLLEYSRVGKVGIKFRSVNLDRLVAIVLNGLSSAINRPDVQINLPKAFPDAIICESRQIEQLIQNLIENAIKFNTKPEKTVDISFEECPNFWTFKVADNGIGIPKKHLKNIFEMFKRLHTFEEFPGTGIGLATCKRIVENHQGKIKVHSVVGEGTTFTFTISKKLKGPGLLKSTLIKTAAASF